MDIKIAVLTSGGDAPGMNAAIRAIVRASLQKNYEVYLVYEGFRGIYNEYIEKADRSKVSEIIMRGGTFIKTSRFPEFKDDKIVEECANILKKRGITHLVTIGGDGTYRGAYALSKHGINVIGIPATIDNDVLGTEETIGFDTALNTIIWSVDKLRDTSSSHHRCSLIEVMGNKCGDLALFGGTACGVDLIISPEYQLSEEEIIKRLNSINRSIFTRHALVLVSEKQYSNLNDLAKLIKSKTGFDTKVEILGHIQRGGSPSAKDRILASRFGVYAIETIKHNHSNICVGIKNGRLTFTPMSSATKISNDHVQELIKVIDILK